MKLQNKSCQISLASIFICVFIPQVHAGLWDNIKNTTKSVTERVVNETIDEALSSEPDETTASSEPDETTAEPTHAPQKPQYDQQLVADTQSQLNRLGYNVGAVDGLYGNGTKRAIERFQIEQKLAVTGEPSASLLSRMAASSPTQQAVAQNSDQTTATPAQPSLQNQAKPEKSSTINALGLTKLPDVVGFKFGMTPDEVLEKLLNYRDDFRITVYNHIPASQGKKSETIKKVGYDLMQDTDKNNLPEHVSNITAYVRGDESFQFLFLKPPASNTLYEVSRGLSFTKDNAPESKKIIDGLKAKYGQVVTEGGSSSGLRWVYDDNGDFRHKTDLYLDLYCARRGDHTTNKSLPSLDTTGGCGTLISATLSLFKGTNFVRSLSVSIEDRKSGLSNREESAALIAQIKDEEMKNKKRDVPNF